MNHEARAVSDLREALITRGMDIRYTPLDAHKSLRNAYIFGDVQGSGHD